MTLTRHPDGPARPRLKTVEDALTAMGLWYPPDAITAVQQGRGTFRSMAGVSRVISDAMRKNIEYAIARTQADEDA